MSDEIIDSVDPTPPVDDNVESAMDKVADSMRDRDMAVVSRAREDEDTSPASKQVLIRATDAEHERWKRAASVQNISMSQMVRDLVNSHVQDVLDCSHPTNMRRYYPWAEFCLKCNLRLRG